MWIYIIISLAVIIFAVLNLRIRKFRAAAHSVAKRLNVKPHLVDGMLRAMGEERGNIFIKHLADGEGKSVDLGAYTLIVYQVIRNGHPENVKWWKNQARENKLDPKLTLETVEIAFMYLRDAGGDISQTWKFLEAYNAIT